MKRIEKLLCLVKEKSSREVRQKLLMTLLKTPLKIPALNLDNDSKPKSGWQVLQNHEKARIKITKDSKGRDSIPAFTANEYLLQWLPEGSYYVALYGRDLFPLCLLNNLNSVIINPGSDLAAEITKEEVKAILNRN